MDKVSPEEGTIGRKWVGASGCILMAACIGNELGIFNVDLAALKAYLIECIRGMGDSIGLRKEKANPLHRMQRFADDMSKHSIVTDKITMRCKAGATAEKNKASVITDLSPNTDVMGAKPPVFIRRDKAGKIWMLVKEELNDWLYKKYRIGLDQWVREMEREGHTVIEGKRKILHHIKSDDKDLVGKANQTQTLTVELADTAIGSDEPDATPTPPPADTQAGSHLRAVK